ncbi:hypothetical protein LEP1GSC108_1442 [Leptospira weilii str. UI 13098]|uniref:Uncharacterized protein n=1 Tax=Leptospira weilii str. UI 13098 TaxID=1088542 RepID=M6PZQ7_9LEPT|nr:hypothetical protein LEP1GSC108_1442 [Leptospira weilii str. UI 13098]
MFFQFDDWIFTFKNCRCPGRFKRCHKDLGTIFKFALAILISTLDILFCNFNSSEGQFKKILNRKSPNIIFSLS